MGDGDGATLAGAVALGVGGTRSGAHPMRLTATRAASAPAARRRTRSEDMVTMIAAGEPATARTRAVRYPRNKFRNTGYHDWEVQPEGLTRLLRRIHDEYTGDRVALYVTENGAAYEDIVEADGRVHDADRAEYLRTHLGAIQDAIDDGVEVKGYFYWSLMDNFEWAWGYDKRFGLLRVDYDTQERTLKDSAIEYARIIAARSLDPALAR